MMTSDWLALLLAAAALAIERLSYIWIWRHPTSFKAFCARPTLPFLGEPVDAVQRLFFGFKVIQATVFIAWIGGFGGWFESGPKVLWASSPAAVGFGFLLISAGQVLNFLVFARLGKKGVFYGTRFGYNVPWVHGFPFSILKHPQYVGTAITIWGLFLATRFPHPDWFLLPLLETVYYTLGAHFEQDLPGNEPEHVVLEPSGNSGQRVQQRPER